MQNRLGPLAVGGRQLKNRATTVPAGTIQVPTLIGCAVQTPCRIED